MLNKTTDALAVASTDSLIAKVTPSNVAKKTVNWTSSNPHVATVDNVGKVTAISTGTTTITATITATAGGKSATCVVTANEEEISAAADKAAAEVDAANEASYDTGITYDQLARTPDKFVGKEVKFTGKVIQVIESDGTDNTNLRIAVNGDYNNILLVEYDPSISQTRVLENDNVTIRGTSEGLTLINLH
jgi:hypothetical protein